MCTSVSKSESPGVGGSHQSAARKTKRPGSPVLTANVLKGVVAANATFDQSTVTVSHSSGVVGQLCVMSPQRSCSVSPLIWGKKANFYLELYVFSAIGQRFPLHYIRIFRANTSVWFVFFWTMVLRERYVVSTADEDLSLVSAAMSESKVR